MLLDNFKIRAKLVIIYIVCVLLPMIVTDSFFVYSVTQNVNRQEYDTMEEVLGQVKNDLNTKVNNVVAISDYLYMNERLEEFISRNYTSHAEYYEYFNQFLEDSVIRYYYTMDSIYNIQICADNKSIINGSYFCDIDEVKGAKWYRQYQENGERTFVMAYYEEDNYYEQSMNHARHISLIRKMDNFGGNAVMKIDFDYTSLAEILERESTEMDIYVDDGKQIILSSDSLENVKEDYFSVSSYEKKDLEVSTLLEVVGDNWNISITMDEYGISEALEGQKKVLFFLVMINLILPSILIIMVDRSFKKRILLTEKYIKKAEQEEFEEIPGNPGKDEVGDLIRSFNLMTAKIRKLIEVVYKKDAEQKNMIIARNRAELDALKRQINPHFMYNTLESIRMHSLVKNEKETADLMGRFSILLRQVTRWSSDFVTVQEEAESVRFYLDIQKTRFGKRMEYSVYVQDEAEQLMIPKFSVMTFVENACIHGIEPRIEGGTISVAITSDEEYIYVEVIDDGCGMTEDALEKLREMIKNASIEDLSTAKSIGILNTVVRMRLYFEETVELEIDSTLNEGTELYIKIPKERRDKNGDAEGDAS